MSTATLRWTDPTTRVDGAPLDSSEIASIDVFDDTGTGPVLQGSVSGAGTTFSTQTLSVGLHTFTVVVNDTTGHVSATSNMAQVIVPAILAAPSAVTDLAVVLNP